MTVSLSVAEREAAGRTIPLDIVVEKNVAEEFICIRCASVQKTCCQRAEVVLTDGDIRRIEAHSGRIDFVDFRTPADPTYVDQDDDPNWVPWTVEPDGTRRVLSRRPDGDCTFLSPAGCSLPGDVRPLICRLYPFSYTERGIDGLDADYCPANLIPRGSTIVDELRMSREDATRWHQMLYRELRERSLSQSPATKGTSES